MSSYLYWPTLLPICMHCSAALAKYNQRTEVTGFSCYLWCLDSLCQAVEELQASRVEPDVEDHRQDLHSMCCHSTLWHMKAA